MVIGGGVRGVCVGLGEWGSGRGVGGGYLRIASPRFLEEDSPLVLVALKPRSPLAAPLPPA